MVVDIVSSNTVKQPQTPLTSMASLFVTFEYLPDTECTGSGINRFEVGAGDITAIYSYLELWWSELLSVDQDLAAAINRVRAPDLRSISTFSKIITEQKASLRGIRTIQVKIILSTSSSVFEYF